MHYNFIEIGTSDFRTVVQTSSPDQVGLCIEPLKHYLDVLPTRDTVIKANYAVSNRMGEINIYHVKPEDIVKYRLPEWVRGCNSVNKPHPTIQKMLGVHHDSIITIDKVQCVTWEFLIKEYQIDTIDYLKVDTEGHDGVILQEYYEECIKNPNIMASTIFFENNILRDSKLNEQVIENFNQLSYKGTSMGDDYKLTRI